MLLPVLVAAALAARAPIPPPPLTACTVAPLPTSVDPPALIAALSAPDPERVSPYRAQVRTDVPVYLSPDTRAYAGDAIAGWHGAVVLADGPVLTLLTREGPVNLLIGVDRSALAPVLTRPVAVAPNPDLPSPPLHVDLAAGAEVRILGGRGPFTEVAWGGEHLVTTGWIPSDAVGVTAAPCPLPDELHDIELVVGGPAIELRDAPDGQILALVAPDHEWMARSLGNTRRKSGSWTALVWTEGPMRVTGWVPSTRVKPTARAHLYSTRRWVDSYVREEPEGAVVSVAPGVVVTASGAPFARFIDPATVPLIKDHGDTVRIRLTTAWGSLEGDVTCPGRTTGASQCSP